MDIYSFKGSDSSVFKFSSSIENSGGHDASTLDSFDNFVTRFLGNESATGVNLQSTLMECPDSSQTTSFEKDSVVPDTVPDTSSCK